MITVNLHCPRCQSVQVYRLGNGVVTPESYRRRNI
ncbi:TPA: IS1 family transposase [Escherichia coli]|nr:hypothetical protein [Escherichia coli]HCP7368302.1 hypothetical protein [Escherichia coli]HCQ9472905.1 hypothetical protein [Escherichia coli]HCT4273410.1 hypothetical protein [Escherichia coli]HCT8341866.1 hypothetical protein [Escherichia coli]